MNGEKQIITVSGGGRVHCEYFATPAPRGTVLMVNGAFATITSLHHTIKYLVEQFNVIAFDLPFAGASRELNPGTGTLEKEREVSILLDLMRIYEPDFAMSMSWGGVSLLLSLPHRPASLKRVILGSFAPEVTLPMREFIEQSSKLIADGEYVEVADLFNRTMGRCLPRIFQGLNARYLGEFIPQAKSQILFHFQHVLSMELQHYEATLAEIDLPLMFVNGELDQFTTPESISRLHLPRAQIRRECVPGAGHFLDMEGTSIRRQMRTLLIDYLLEGAHAAPEHA